MSEISEKENRLSSKQTPSDAPNQRDTKVPANPSHELNHSASDDDFELAPAVESETEIRNTEENSEFSNLRKLYALPISEIEELLAWQQQVQARTYKIVRHLRAAEDKIAQIKREKDELSSQLEASSNQNSELKTRVQELESKLASSESTSHKLQTQNQQLEQSINDQRAKLDDQANSISALNQQHEKSISDIKTQLANAVSVARQVEAAKNKIIQQHGEKEVLSKEVQASRAKIAELEKQLSDSADERTELLGLMKSAMARLEKRTKDSSS
ncbi:MAG: hypothetical protein R3C03_19390 [Pirellulaceae bacterium]